MTLTFADTHNMIAYLTKSDASEGFDQIIYFLNASSIKYALTVNPNIYVLCAKQFWSSVPVKKVNDVTRLQALVDRTKVIISEATIQEALRLDDAKSIDCLPNEEIFTELSWMGYEKPFTKLTFYNEFFSPQWKFLIHTILQCMSAKRTSWNEFSSSMASAVICLSTVIPTPPTLPIAQPPSPQQQPQPSHDVEVSMGLLHTLLETWTTLTRRVEHLEQNKIAQTLEIIKLKQRVKKLERKNKLKVSKLRRLKKVGITQRVDTSKDTVMDDVSKQGEIIATMDADEDVTLNDVTAVTKEVVVEKDAEIEENADDDELEPAELKKVVEVVTTAKLMTEVITAASATITAGTTLITAATVTAARRRKGVVIRDPEETAKPSIIIHSKPKSKDKGKRIMVKEPKPLKKQAHIEQDEAYARENMAGFKMDYFKGMSYDDIRPIFEKYFNSNVAFLEKTKEHMEEEDSKTLKRASESQAEKAVKKQKLDEKIVKKRFASSKPKNFSDDFLLTTLTYMFEKPDVQAQVWKNQRTVHGLAKICKATTARRIHTRVVFGYILHKGQAS
nr:hypothetical protein [Tanacetum cinerariifolium]